MSCVATPAHASESFEWRIRQRSHARPAVQRGGSGEELLYFGLRKESSPRANVVKMFGLNTFFA